MRKIVRRLGRQILKFLAKKAIQKHKPTIIGIVGSGETAICREVVFTALSQSHPTRRNLENPSVEFALPLTILGADEYPPTTLHWIALVLKTIWQLLTIKPYHHFLVLEMSPAISETLDYWLAMASPKLIIACGDLPENFPKGFNILEIKNPTLSQIKEKAIEVAMMFGGNAETDKKSLEKVTFYPTRIRFFPGRDGGLIVDATHYYYPIPLKAVVELVENLPGQKIIISNEAADTLPSDFKITKESGLGRSAPEIIIVRGKRNERFDLLEDLTGGNYE